MSELTFSACLSLACLAALGAGGRLRFLATEFSSNGPRVLAGLLLFMRYRQRWSNHGTTFFGSEGWVSVDRGGIEASSAALYSVEFGPSDKRLYKSAHHQRNFIDCVKSRSETISPFEAAIRSDTISHLSDIVVRKRRPIEWDPKQEQIVGDADAARLLARPMRKKWAV